MSKEIKKILVEIKDMIYQSRSPKMDGSHILNTRKVDKLLNQIHFLLPKEDWNKWITPEKYKQLTGKDWPDDGPVFERFDNEWFLTDFMEAKYYSCYDFLVIANEHGKPPADFIPED